MLAACAPAGTSVKTNADGSMQMNTSEGSFSTGKTIPKDWPKDAPVYAGAEVEYSAAVNTAEGKPGYALILLTSDATAKVSAYYKAELAKQGWKIEGAMEGNGTTVIGATKGDRVISVSVASSEGQTGITIGVGKSE